MPLPPSFVTAGCGKAILEPCELPLNNIVLQYPVTIHGFRILLLRGGSRSWVVPHDVLDLLVVCLAILLE